MVSHAWSTNFAATSGMLMQHALSRRSSAVDEKETEQSMCYWCLGCSNMFFWWKWRIFLWLKGEWWGFPENNGALFGLMIEWPLKSVFFYFSHVIFPCLMMDKQAKDDHFPMYNCLDVEHWTVTQKAEIRIDDKVCRSATYIYIFILYESMVSEMCTSSHKKTWRRSFWEYFRM